MVGVIERLEGVSGYINYYLLLRYNCANAFLFFLFFLLLLFQHQWCKITTLKAKVLHLNFLRGKFFRPAGPIRAQL